MTSNHSAIRAKCVGVPTGKPGICSKTGERDFFVAVVARTIVYNQRALINHFLSQAAGTTGFLTVGELNALVADATATAAIAKAEAQLPAPSRQEAA